MKTENLDEIGLVFYMEMQRCPWFTQHRTNECICEEYRNVEKTLVVVNNECPQHGCSENMKENKNV